MNPSDSKKSLKQCSPLGGLQGKNLRRIASWHLLFMVFLGVTHVGHAQWQTQSIELKLGWNAVFLHVDASHETLTTLPPPAAIDQIWLWNRISSGDRFVTDPSTQSTSQDWLSWLGSNSNPESEFPPPGSDTLERLIGNAAYLVHAIKDYEWSIKGKPLPPTVASYGWTSRGVNLIGFSVPTDEPPTFSNFLSHAGRLGTRGEFYRYDDGNGDLTPSLFNAFFNTVKVNRGQAYWVRHEGEFNRYFGTFELILLDPSGIHFRDSLSHQSLRIRNNISEPLKVNIALDPSEKTPSNEDVTEIPLLMRGQMNKDDFTFGAETFESQKTFVLAPKGELVEWWESEEGKKWLESNESADMGDSVKEVGSEFEMVLGVDRFVMGKNPNAIFAGILSIADTLNYTQMDVGVSAQHNSVEGLWVGTAVVNQVGHYLKIYQEDKDEEVVLNEDLSYKVKHINKDLGTVSQPAKLRLILHHGTDSDGTSGTRLMQRVFYGLNTNDEKILTTKQAALDSDQLASARRISAVHLPFDQNKPFWDFKGDFAVEESMTADVLLDNNEQQSNPFLHTYHPDHDNLDDTYKYPQDRGLESYDLERSITLEFTAPGEDFASRVSGDQQRSGNYKETITVKGLEKERIDSESGVKSYTTDTFKLETSGGFSINRISSIEALTTAP
jgi:hypothetical protein